jgi:hypothetical protein
MSLSRNHILGFMLLGVSTEYLPVCEQNTDTRMRMACSAGWCSWFFGINVAVCHHKYLKYIQTLKFLRMDCLIKHYYLRCGALGRGSMLSGRELPTYRKTEGARSSFVFVTVRLYVVITQTTTNWISSVIKISKSQNCHPSKGRDIGFAWNERY